MACGGTRLTDAQGGEDGSGGRVFMDTDGPHDAPTTPPPPPPPPPPAPPRAEAVAPASSLDDWLRTPRRGDAPGVWRYGHVPRPPEKADGGPNRAVVGG